MRRIYFAISLLIASSCSFGHLTEEVEMFHAERNVTEATLRIRTVQDTKGGTISDTAIATMQVLVFDSRGVKEYDNYYGEWNGTADCRMQSGQKKIWLIANSPEIEDIVTEESLGEIYIGYPDLSPSETGGLLMTTSFSKRLIPGVNSCEASLTRRVTKITLEPIDVSGMNPALREVVSFSGVFLINVRNSISLYGQSPATSDSYFYPGGCNPDGSPVDAIRGIHHSYWPGCDLVSGVDLTGSSTTLYCFPNYQSAGDTAYSGTILVVQAVTASGSNWYYPVRLPSPLKENHSYNVVLSVSGPGSNHPGEFPDYGNYSASFYITAWKEEANYIENL